MSIATGSRLGPYEILARIGAGGMGEVWRARDTRLERDVAIKVLPASLAHDPQFRARFEREAKTISQLNHPHICQIYDVGEAAEDKTSYLVMELLEGESLADRLVRGALPLSDVLRYGAQIAEGLAAAHRAGIVHRDLKPGNIMITKAGAKLLDFGLAKGGVTPSPAIVAGTAFSGETEHKPLTQEGTIIGTFQYMAPEQLEGLQADARTDIFALGAVLYEMVTGKRAFEGKTKTSLIAAIVDREPPPISQFQPLTPPAFERLVKTALEKDPDNRWQTAHDLLLQLRWIAEAGSQAGVPVPLLVRRKQREQLAWICAFLFLLTAGVFAFLWQRLAQEPVRRVETSILPPEKSSFNFGSGGLALSPDGQKLIFVASTDGKIQLWIRRLGAGTAQPLSGTAGASYPFWSPDSRFVAFFAGGKLRKIDSGGGPPQVICDAPNGRGGSWNDENLILFAPSDRDPIHRVSSGGGVSTAVTQLKSDTEFSHRWPSFLPDGKHFLFLAQSVSSERRRGRIHAGNLGTNDRKEILITDSPALISASGHLLFVRDRSLLAQPFDADGLVLTGEAFPIADRVQYVPSTTWGAFTVAKNGTLAYQSGGTSAATQLTWLDRSGKALGVLTSAGQHVNPRLSRKGDRVAYELADDETGDSDIWIYDLARNIPTRFSFEPGREASPVWASDDARIFYCAEDEGRTTWSIVQKVSSGAGREETVLAPRTQFLSTVDIDRDGRHLSYNRIDIKSRAGRDLWIYSFANRQTVPLLQTRFQDMGGFFSPDGRWIAYVSDESGAREVYVQPFPPNGAKWQISSSGGGAPRWRRDGRELFFAGETKMMSVAVTTNESSFSAAVPQILFDAQVLSGYDVTADGQRFLINKLVNDEVQQPVTVVLNWAAEREK